MKVVGKNAKERLLPAPVWVLDAMKAVSRLNKGTGWSKSRKTIWKYLNKRGMRRPHGLRHTYASQLLRERLKLQEIQLLLGHALLQTSAIYARTQVPADVMELLDGEKGEEEGD